MFFFGKRLGRITPQQFFEIVFRHTGANFLEGVFDRHLIIPCVAPLAYSILNYRT